MSINNPQNSNNNQNTTSNIVQKIVGGVVNNLTSDTANNMSNAVNLYAIANGYKDSDYVNSSLGLGAMGMNLLNTPISNALGLGIPLAGDIINKDWKGLGLDSARILADKILYNKLYKTTTSSMPATLANAPNTALNSAANTIGITNSNLNAVDPGNMGLDNTLDSKTSSINPPDNSLKKAALVSNIISKTGMKPLLNGGVSIIGSETLGTPFLQGFTGATFPLSVPAFFAGLGLSIASMVKKKQWEKDLNRYNQRLSDFEQYNEKYAETPQLSNLNNDLLNEYLGRALIDRSAADSLVNGVDNSRNMLTNLRTDPQIQQTLANIGDTIQQARLNIQNNNIKELVLDPYSYSNKTPQELNLYKAAIQKNITELDNSLEAYASLAGDGVGKEMYEQAIKEIDSIIADKAYKGGVNYGKYTPENSGPSIYEKAKLTKLNEEKSSLATNIYYWQKQINSLKQELEASNNSNPLMSLISQFKNKDKIEDLRIAEENISNYQLRAKEVDAQMAALQGNVETNTNNNETVDKTPVNSNTEEQNNTNDNQNNSQEAQNNNIDPINNNENGTIDDDTINNQYEENDDNSNSNNVLQGNVEKNVLNSDINSDTNPIFPWHIKDKELDNAVFDSVIKTVIDSWNEKQSKRVYNNNFDKTEYMTNTRKWAPQKGSAWHEDNFKNTSTVEQVIYADSIHLMNIPEKDLTPEDRDHFEENIKLLSVLKSLKDGTMKQHVSEELERLKLIEEIRKVAASKGLNMPDLSHMNNQQMPYSRIPRGLNVSRGDGRVLDNNLYTEKELKIRREYESDVRSLDDNLIDRTNFFIAKLQQDNKDFSEFYNKQNILKQKLLMFDYIYSPLVKPNNLINDTIMADKIVKPEYYKFAEFGYRLAEYELAVNSENYEYKKANGYGKVKGNPLDGQDLVDTIKQTANKKYKSIFKRKLTPYEMDSVISGWSLKQTEKDIQTPWKIKRGIWNIINYEFENYRLPKITEKLMIKYMPEYNNLESSDLKEKIKIKVSKYLDENYLKVNKSKIDQFGLPNRIIRISSPYGYRKIKYGSKYHRGIDIGGELHSEINNLPIPSQFDGRVIASSRMGAAGETVIIQTEDSLGNKKLTLYMHMNKRNVFKGDIVKRNSTIGTLGGTGKTDKSYNPHLHFEIRDINNNSIDYGQKGMDMLNLLTLNYLEKKFKNDNVRIINNIKKYLQKEKIVITSKK